MLSIKRSPVLLRKSLLRVIPAVALSCLGSSLAYSMTMSANYTGSARIAVGIQYLILCSLFPLLVFVHHMFRLWRWRYWLTIIELIVSVIELTTFTIFLVFAWITIAQTDTVNDLHTNYITSMEGLPWLYPGSFLLLAFLCLLSLLTTIWDVMSGRIMDVFKPYHCLSDEPRGGWAVLVGVSALKKRFSTDRHWFIIIRACVAALAVLALILAGIWMILGQPLNQISGSVEIRTFYNVAIGSGIVGVHHKSINLLVGSPRNFTNFGYNWTEVVDQSLNVTIISEEVADGSLRMNQYTLDCDPAMSTDILQHVSVHCPLNLDPEVQTLKLNYLTSFDFSPLIPGTNNGTLPPDLWTSVYLGFSEFPLDVYLNTVPVYLFPGSRILGQAEMIYRDVLMDSLILILGLPSYRRILTARVYSWQVEDNGLVPLPNNNTGVAKITPLHINPVRYERDYLAKSIFGSFATLGGIWTFLNGVFAIIFGSTLLLTLLDQKPLSIYGLVHTLRQDPVTRVRNKHDSLSPEEQQRIITMLRDHLLDVHMLDEQQPTKGAILSSPETHPDPTTQQLLPNPGVDAATKQDDEEMELYSYPKSAQ